MSLSLAEMTDFEYDTHSLSNRIQYYVKDYDEQLYHVYTFLQFLSLGVYKILRILICSDFQTSALKILIRSWFYQFLKQKNSLTKIYWMITTLDFPPAKSIFLFLELTGFLYKVRVQDNLFLLFPPHMGLRFRLSLPKELERL